MCELSASIRERTEHVHKRAERTGIIRDMLNNRVTLGGYQLYLRNLYEIYSTLELCGQRPESAATLGPFISPELCRAPAIANDLGHLQGRDWQRDIPVLASAIAYRDRIERLSRESSNAELVAHAYVRYLGDLSGGQLLVKRLGRYPGLAAEQMSFYKFERISDLQGAKRRFRQALDEFGTVTADPEQVLGEAKRAFELNIELSVEVKEYTESGA